MPICVSFSFANNKENIIVDTTCREEFCVEGTMVIACNKRSEICALHQSGSFVINQRTILFCVKSAMERTLAISAMINDVLVEDKIKRASRMPLDGFDKLIEMHLLTSNESKPTNIYAPSILQVKLEEISVQQKEFIVKESVLNSKNAAETEEKDISDQLAQIAVQSNLSEKPVVVVEKMKRKKNEVNDVQDFLDDLGEDIEMLLPSASTTKTPKVESEIAHGDVDLTSALKKKKKKL